MKKLLSSLQAVSSCQLPQSQNQHSPHKFDFSNNANNFWEGITTARIASIKCPKYQLLCEWESRAMKGPVRWGSLSWNRSTLCVKRKDILAVRSVLMMLFRPVIMLFAPLPFSPNETIYTQPVSFSASYPAVVSICICIMFLSALAIFPLIRIVIFPFLSIGYPVVTLGFGFKSYVGYRMRQRRQKVKTRIDSSVSWHWIGNWNF